MPTTYTYSISADLPVGKINSLKLSNEILAEAGITTTLDAVNTLGDVLDIIFATALSAGEKTILDGDVTGPAGGLLANHDHTFLTVDREIADEVIDKDLTVPPVSPADGDTYIVAASATGAWTGRDKKIARWDATNSEWAFVNPVRSQAVWVIDEKVEYHYDDNFPTGEWTRGDAAELTYEPATLTDWNGDADPGDIDDALDQLAERTDDLENTTYTKTELDGGQLDNQYFQESEYIDSSAGAGDSGKPIKTNSSGLVDNTMLPSFGSGDVTASSNIPDHEVTRGDGGTKGIQGSKWKIDDDGALNIDASKAGYLLDLHNTNVAGGGDGIIVLAGEVSGDITMRLCDQDGSIELIDVEANGHVTFGKTYSATVTANGNAFGIDNQYGAGEKADFNTQNGTYKIAGVDVVIPPAGTAGQVLEKIDGTNYNTQWATPATGSGDVTAASNLADNCIVRGDGGVKGVQDTGWGIADDGAMTSGMSKAGYILDVHNTLATGGGNGFRIKAGELDGDIAFHVADQDDTFQIMELEADQGHVTFGKTYAQTLTDNGVVYGLDNQQSGVATDFNTQNGIYRIGGKAVIRGTYFQDVESNSESSTTSSTFQTKLTMTTPSLPSGKYRVGWCADIKGGGDCRVQVLHGATELSASTIDSSTDGFNAFGGFKYLSSLSGVQNFYIKYRNEGAGTSWIKNARFEIWRIS